VAASLFAFIVAYFAVFAAGLLYIVRLMGHTPRTDEPDIEADAPLRAAGIAPAPALELSEHGAGSRGS